MTGLSAHGFLDAELADDAANICDIIPKAKEIARVGGIHMVHGQEWRFLTKGLVEPDLLAGWHLGELFREGTYGKIHHAHRMVVRRTAATGHCAVIESPHTVVIKKTVPPSGAELLPEEEVMAHVSESLLHVLAWRTMQKTAAKMAIPRPYEVFGDYVGSGGGGAGAGGGWKSMSLCMAYVNGRTLHTFFGREWKKEPCVENARMLLETLAQTAYILWFLQRRLRLNHRDMKINNLLIRRVPAWTLELAGAKLTTAYELTLIDFGFACVGCPPPRQPMTVMQAGSWFPLGELCCKVGRDIAQLIYCVHCYFPLPTFLPPAVVATLRSWMQITIGGQTVDMLNGFTPEGRPRRTGASGAPEFNTGIYEFLRRHDIDPMNCAPSLVFSECCRLMKELV
jgi:serine/threonine protein kinase